MHQHVRSKTELSVRYMARAHHSAQRAFGQAQEDGRPTAVEVTSESWIYRTTRKCRESSGIHDHSGNESEYA